MQQQNRPLPPNDRASINACTAYLCKLLTDYSQQVPTPLAHPSLRLSDRVLRMPRAYVSLQIAMTCKRVRTVMYSPPDRYVALTDSPDWLIPSCTTMEHKPSCHNNHKRPQSMNYGLARAKQKDCRLALAGAAQLVDFCYMLPRIWMHIYHHHSVMST